MNIPTILAILLVLSAIFFGGRLSVTQSRQYQSDQRSLALYNKEYLSKVGSTSLIGDGTPTSYVLRSFDGGQTWYSVEYGPNHEVIILGLADPELVAHHDAMVKLGDYVRENGPINAGNPEGIRILEAAGFTVETLPSK